MQLDQPFQMIYKLLGRTPTQTVKMRFSGLTWYIYIWIEIFRHLKTFITVRDQLCATLREITGNQSQARIYDS